VSSFFEFCASHIISKPKPHKDSTKTTKTVVIKLYQDKRPNASFLLAGPFSVCLGGGGVPAVVSF
jgi:hypothetical protein